MSNSQRTGASFRDPSGFLFVRDGTLYRQVNQSYQEDYELLIESGLYQDLVEAGLLIPHQESQAAPHDPDLAYKILQPEPLPFVSYPYEWSFSQLKDAARTTLKVLKRALAHGMTLKDSSAYNIQFRRGRPLLIDTLSFARYVEGAPWDAYRQFCQHFLAPLALMAHRDVRLGQLLRVHIDGLPLDLASRLLPVGTRFDFSLLTHIHLHARAQARYAGRQVARGDTGRGVSRAGFQGLIDSLEAAVRKLRWEPAGTAWEGYYQDHNYSPEAFAHKEALVKEFLDRIQPGSVWDLGANTGVFSRLASALGIPTLAFDIDPGAVERCYLDLRAHPQENLLPLVMDLTNPSPALGWGLSERMSLMERGSADALLALALVHHLAIGQNLPLEWLAEFFQRLSPWLIIEFVPKEDSQVQRLLASREDIFPEYYQEGFERAFSARFHTQAVEPIKGSLRRLYLLERRE